MQETTKTALIVSEGQLPQDALFIAGKWFTDGQGRTVLLRGVNVSGACKLPALPIVAQTTHEFTDEWLQHREVSFVGRPFPLADAREHVMRLRGFGFNFLRLCVTWEAIEHAGPRQYDTDYLQYLVQVLQAIRQHSQGTIKVFIDPHQDCWSRFTGGSGAPGWTLELAGFDLEALTDYDVGCAVVHNRYPQSDQLPKMIWPTNYYKLGCLVMFTMFFGGRQYLPRCVVIDDAMRILGDSELSQFRAGQMTGAVNVQDYLQRHYMDAIVQIIKTIKRVDASLLDSVVTGYDTLNEPSSGLLGYETLARFSKHHDLKIGPSPTAIECMLLGQGLDMEVELWNFGNLGPTKKGYVVMNTQRKRVWRSGYGCPFEAHGLYNTQERTVLQDDYFRRYNGRDVDYVNDFWLPFAKAYTQAIRVEHSNAIIFADPTVNEVPPKWNLAAEGTKRVVYAPHWYDGVTLMNKSFTKWWNVDYIGYKRHKYLTILSALSFGLAGDKNCFRKQLETIKNEGQKYFGDVPCIMGEIGIPYDMDGKRAYERQQELRADIRRTHTSTYDRLMELFVAASRDPYDKQMQAMDANFCALEANMLNVTLWNYCPVNDHQWGDQWNNEDLSLWSPEDVVRPSMIAEVALDCKLENMDDTRSLSTRVTEVSNAETVLATATMDDSDESILGTQQRKRFHTSPLITPLATSTPDHYSVALNQGARALGAFVRPYPRAICGQPMSFSFDYDTKIKQFKLQFRDSTHKFANGFETTEIFTPLFHYGLPLAQALQTIAPVSVSKIASGFVPSKSPTADSADAAQQYFEVRVSDGTWQYDWERQMVLYTHSASIEVHEVIITAVPRGDAPNRLHQARVKARKFTVVSGEMRRSSTIHN